MAYGLKYELLCTSKVNAYAYKLKLLFDGFEGDDIDRNIPMDAPLILRKDKATVVRGTSLDFAIREAVNFELDEFYTNNPKKIKGELYLNTTLLWTGYVLPQQYEAPYVPAPLNVRFTATDGLGLLKNEDFTLTGNNSQLAIIIYCLDKIGLGLGYSIAINLFETTHNHTYSPLAQTFEDAEIYEDDDCYTVLEKILQKYDAEITQFNGMWHITCSADKKSTRMLYTSAGVYTGTEAVQAVLDLGYPGTGIEVWPVGSLNRSLEAGAKKVILTHNYGRKESMLDNYDFWRFSGGEFASWTKGGTFNLYQRILEGEAYAFLSGGDSDGTDQIYQEIELEDPAGEDFVLELLVAPIGKNTDGGITSINMTVRFAVLVLVGATAYYLIETGVWTTTPTIISKTILSSISAPVWNAVSILADGLPGSGTLTVALYRYGEEETPHTGDVFSGIAFSKPKIYFLSDGQLYASGVKTLATFNDSTEPDDLGTISLSAADAPSYDNRTSLYKNITTLSGGDPTTLWHRLGSGTEYLFMVQLACTLASRSRSARQILKGTIRGTGLNFGSFIKHTYNSNCEFEIAEGTWDLYEEKWDVMLLELLAWSDEDITFTDTEENGASSSAPAQNTPQGGMVIGNAAGNANTLNCFEIVNPGADDEYLLCKLPLATAYDIQTYSTFADFPNTIWEDMPIASATVKGAIKVGTGLTIDENGVLNAEAGEPGAGEWGSIIGDIGDQTDLQTALGTKATTIHNLIDTTNHPVTGLTTGHFLKALSSSTYGFAAHGLTYTSVGACSTSDSRLSDARIASDVYAWAKAASKPSYTYSEVGALAAGGTAADSDKLDGQHGSYYQAALTFGIANTNKVQINASDVADNDYAKFTASGLEGRSYAEVLSDIGAAAVAQTMYIGTTAVAINRASGTMALAGITTLSVVTVNATGEVTAYYTSDERLKENITSFFALELIGQMNPVSFNWNDKARELNAAKDDRVNYGLIAQNIEQVLPELVHPVYTDYKAIDYIQLVPILIQAVKEQQKQISELKKDLTYFKNYNM